VDDRKAGRAAQVQKQEGQEEVKLLSLCFQRTLNLAEAIFKQPFETDGCS